MNKERLTVAILAVLLFASAGFCQDRFDFRKTKWGMTRDEVKRSESLQPVGEKKDKIFYKSTLDETPCMIAYHFLNNKLAQALYLFDQKHANPSDFIDDYNRILALLTEKYGKPVKAYTRWTNPLYENDPRYWGTALKLGHMSKIADWTTDSSEIHLSLLGDMGGNMEVNLGIAYFSKRLKSLLEREINNKAKDDL
ncbi:MAG: hypothetical protein ACLQVJ_12325 [Syntrophobacteraceae bacterium]